jgi:hypothetical protein
VVAGSPNGQAVKGGLFCHVAEQGLPEPAFVAASDKTLIKGKRTQVESTTVPHKTTVPQRKKEEKKPSKGEIKDPYWEPCDYGQWPKCLLSRNRGALRDGGGYDGNLHLRTFNRRTEHHE